MFNFFLSISFFEAIRFSVKIYVCVVFSAFVYLFAIVLTCDSWEADVDTSQSDCKLDQVECNYVIDIANMSGAMLKRASRLAGRLAERPTQDASKDVDVAHVENELKNIEKKYILEIPQGMNSDKQKLQYSVCKKNCKNALVIKKSKSQKSPKQKCFQCKFCIHFVMLFSRHLYPTRYPKAWITRKRWRPRSALWQQLKQVVES